MVKMGRRAKGGHVLIWDRWRFGSTEDRGIIFMWLLLIPVWIGEILFLHMDFVSLVVTMFLTWVFWVCMICVMVWWYRKVVSWRYREEVKNGK